MGFAQPALMREVQADPNADFIFGLGAGHPKALRPKAATGLAKTGTNSTARTKF